MKVLVPVKQVARLEDDFTPDGAATVPVEELEWQPNEWDAFSLEAALELVESVDGGEVVAVTVGDERAEEGLLACLAKGADRAIRVWDDALEGADALVVAAVLAAVVDAERPELVLCGVQSSDAANAATGIALAGLTELAHVAVVKEIALAGETLTVHRELDGGEVEVLRVALPALLTVQTGINEPRYATLRAIKQARAKPLDTLALADVGLDADSVLAAAGARIVRLGAPERGEGATMLDGSPAEIAERIASIVREEVAS
jgi:electron transfer flavoprotein beta subunit